MNRFFPDPPTENHKAEPDKHILVSIPEEYYTSEGSEFLDDAIRMKEQPLKDTEELLQSEAPKVNTGGSKDIQQ